MAGDSPNEAGAMTVFEAANSPMKALGAAADSMVAENFMEAEGSTVEAVSMAGVAATEAAMADTDNALERPNLSK
jgi:hypothetical protein